MAKVKEWMTATSLCFFVAGRTPFDFFIITIGKTQGIFQTEGDISLIRKVVSACERTISLLKQKNMIFQAKELTSATADFLFGLDRNVVTRQYAAVRSDVCWERLQSLFGERKNTNLKSKIRKIIILKKVYLSFLSGIYTEFFGFLLSAEGIVDEGRKDKALYLSLKYVNSAIPSTTFKAFMENDDNTTSDSRTLADKIKSIYQFMSGS